MKMEVKCKCGLYSGITPKAFTDTKIWRCEKHGFICPLCGHWQFKEIEKLEMHLMGGCEGVTNYGVKQQGEVLFEIYVFKEFLNK